MFICGSCSGVTKPGIKGSLMVIATRPKRYPYRRHATKSRRGHTRDDPGGEGREIASEMRVCPSCYANEMAARAEDDCERKG